VTSAFPPVEPIRRRKLSEEVAEQLQAMMLNGQLKPGENLPSERTLMSTFGVGRSSVREALFSLQRMGLVVVRNGEPACVTKPSAKALVEEFSGAVAHILSDVDGARELQQARALYETILVRYAAKHASEADIALLKKALDANRQAIGRPEDFARTDVAFHQILAEIPRNSIFTSLQTALSTWLAEQRFVSLKVPQAEQSAYEAHEQIYLAVAAHDPDLAESVMISHLEAVGDFYWRSSQSGQ
jgi:DNA-binding FadR family transcriptional regulator